MWIDKLLPRASVGTNSSGAVTNKANVRQSGTHLQLSTTVLGAWDTLEPNLLVSRADGPLLVDKCVLSPVTCSVVVVQAEEWYPSYVDEVNAGRDKEVCLPMWIKNSLRFLPGQIAQRFPFSFMAFGSSDGGN